MFNIFKSSKQKEQEAFKMFDKYGFLFGSRALEVYTDKSDYDYLITVDNFQFIRSVLDIHMKDQTPYEGRQFGIRRYSIETHKGKVDLIVAHEADIVKVSTLTKYLQSLPKALFQKKEDRVKIFEAFYKENYSALPKETLNYLKQHNPELLI